MISTFAAGQDEIANRVRQFQINFKAYHAPDYKEAHARQELIDWLFIALGWDVRNERGAAPHRREVIPEASQDVEGQKKAPDYAFRFGSDTVFYVEAKKPGVAIKTAASAAFQLRRYAWSARLSLSLLTDFEELAVYDCRVRPSDQDKASVARINYYTWEQYADLWREIWDVYSREAVERGTFDQYVQDARGKRGTTPVDAEFLKEIEGWRDVLARNLALRNAALSIDELNDAVQRTIDRIIFLRMAEDRGIEPYARLQALAAHDEIYAGLLDLCRQADAKYNSGLFDFSAKGDRLTPKLIIDDKVLRPILSDLYFPHPYEFSVMPTKILGNVYEQFLGKVIRLTPAHQARVEEKPEVKKAGGIRYTPDYIVDNLVAQTIGPWIAAHVKPTDRAPLPPTFRVIDISCGSGSFALGAYQYLLDYYLQWYLDHLDLTGGAKSSIAKRDAVLHLSGLGEWRLTVAEKKRILTAHIFGVDIDRQAVEVTKLSLLLKVLEGESDETLQLKLFDHERALPNLDANIKCGNSLIGPDFFADQLLPDADEMKRVNPFDWAREFPDAMKAGGFDCIVGNPPYIRIHNLVDYYPTEVRLIQENFATAKFGKVDIYVAFVEKALDLLQRSGRVGYIVPNKFMQADYGIGLRKLLTEKRVVTEIVDFGNAQVFEGVTTYTCLLFLTGSPQDEFLAKFNRSYESPVEFLLKAQAEKRQLGTLGAAAWQSASSIETSILNKLTSMQPNLSDICDLAITGVKTGANSIYVFAPTQADTATRLVHLRAEDTDTEVELETGLLVPYLKAESLKRYNIGTGNRLLLYPYRFEQEETRLVPESQIRLAHPKTWRYLIEHKQILESRQKGKLKGPSWYGLSFASSLRMFKGPKIVTPTLAPRNSFSIDTGGHFFPQGAGGGCGLIPHSTYNAHYLLGLLNSHLLTFFFQRISSQFQGGWYAYEPRYLNRIPVHVIDFTNAADKAAHDRMVKLVDTMLQLHPRLAAAQSAHDRDLIQRQIDATDRQIDALVYQLYGLTDDEIKIVEGR